MWQLLKKQKKRNKDIKNGFRRKKLRKPFFCKNSFVLTPEDHKALHKYIETKDEMTIFEHEYYYLAGQMMTFSYGRMLAQLKNEMLNEDSRASTHLIEIGLPQSHWL